MKDTDLYDEIELGDKEATVADLLEKFFEIQSSKEEFQNWEVKALLDGKCVGISADSTPSAGSPSEAPSIQPSLQRSLLGPGGCPEVEEETAHRGRHYWSMGLARPRPLSRMEDQICSSLPESGRAGSPLEA